jgi:tRNA threonylcarbamoyladenosine biosynthesis protein TsaE
MKKTLLSQSVEETQKIGVGIAEKLKGGEIIFLSGILGAGKTELIRGIAKGLGIETKITSPTFNIFRVYEFGKSGKLYHFDCYRLKKYADLVELGWEEILADPKAIVVLEWPECILDEDITKSNQKIAKINIKIENHKRLVSIK